MPAAAGVRSAAAGKRDRVRPSRVRCREKSRSLELICSQTQQNKDFAKSIADFLSCEPEIYRRVLSGRFGFDIFIIKERNQSEPRSRCAVAG